MMAMLYHLCMSGAQAGERGVLYRLGTMLAAACYFTLIWGPLAWWVVKNGLRRRRALAALDPHLPEELATRSELATAWRRLSRTLDQFIDGGLAAA
jgi:type II secretory pathway component PulM